MGPFLVRLAILAAIGSAAGGGAYAVRDRYLPAAAVLPGLKIAGVPVLAAARGDVRAFVAARAAEVEGRHVQLAVRQDPGEAARVVAELTLKDLGVAVDVDRVTARVLAIGHDGDLLERIAIARSASAGEIDVPLVVALDGAAAMPLLARLKEAEDSAPVSARLDLDHRMVTAEKNGQYIDVNGALAAFEAAAADPSVTKILLPVSSFPPRVTSALVSKLAIEKVLSEYETYFSRAGDQSRRGRNIDVASSKLDGLVLSPGELISFNAIVGERSEENGFEKSWEIFKGEMVEGIGGGTCQVASTFHAVAFFAGLEILERLPHSRPSAYIPMGLDSTVVYPVVDLKVRNPHAFPVVLHAKTEGNKLKMQLLGAEQPARVSFGRELLATVGYPRKIVEEPGLHGKKVIVKQHGIRGFRIKRSRVLRFADGTTRTEKNTDFYPPTTEIYAVPVDFDVALLPPLPIEDADTGEGSDKSAAAAAAAATPSSAASATPPLAAAVPCAGDCPPGAQAATDLQMVDAPGSHAPTTNQANPAKTVWMKR